jgi:amino acid transporter
MQDAPRTALSVWESYYVIVGSSGAALTGLQFVVIALVAETRTRSTTREIDAFGTPTIVHFCTVLLLSAILSVPWQALSSVALALGAVGLAGIVYGVIVVRRARRTTEYKPVLEDWLWHTIFPLICHTALVAAAIALSRGMVGALFVIAAVCLCLLFIGIHNAWDTVVYIAIERAPKARRET